MIVGRFLSDFTPLFFSDPHEFVVCPSLQEQIGKGIEGPDSY